VSLSVETAIRYGEQVVTGEINVLQIAVELEGRRVHDLDAVLFQHYPLNARIQRDRYYVQVGAYARDNQGVVVASTAIRAESPCLGRAESEKPDQDEQMENAIDGKAAPRCLQIINKNSD